MCLNDWILEKICSYLGKDTISYHTCVMVDVLNLVNGIPQ